MCFSRFSQYPSPKITIKMSRCMGKPTICIGENKCADQLHSNCEADQCLCFASRIVQFLYCLKPKFPASSVTVQAGLCWTWWEVQIVGFLMHRLIFVQFKLHRVQTGQEVEISVSSHPKYCRSGNIRENLIFANIRELVASRIQSSR